MGRALAARVAGPRVGRHGQYRARAATWGGHGDASRFYRGLDGARGALRPGPARRPIRCTPPPGAVPMPRVLRGPARTRRTGFSPALDDAAFERQARAWCTGVLRGADAGEADVLHLHHLTPGRTRRPLAWRRTCRWSPTCTAQGVAHARGDRGRGGARSWPHGDAWADRMRSWAARARRGSWCCRRSQIQRAERLLGADPGPASSRSPTASTRARVRPPPASTGRRTGPAISWQQPQQRESTAPRTCARSSRARWCSACRALHRGQADPGADRGVRPGSRPADPAALVLVGGHPGEHEGEHPAESIERTAVRATSSSPAGTTTTTFRPSCRRQTSSCWPRSASSSGRCSSRRWRARCQPIGVKRPRAGRPRSSRDGRTGWLVAPDDGTASLAEALCEAIDDPAERGRRSTAAREVALERYAWPALAGRLAEVLEAPVRTATY